MKDGQPRFKDLPAEAGGTTETVLSGMSGAERGSLYARYEYPLFSKTYNIFSVSIVESGYDSEVAIIISCLTARTCKPMMRLL